ncbi:MAG: hypothetical protein ACRDTM_08975 [Micromonosporaceae bacterium]
MLRSSAAGYDYAQESLTQTVTVPANGTLRYWWCMTTGESGSTVWDTMRVRVYDANTRSLLHAAYLEQRQRRQRLAGGRTVPRRVRRPVGTAPVHVQTDYSLPTSFFVDDVSLR